RIELAEEFYRVDATVGGRVRLRVDIACAFAVARAERVEPGRKLALQLLGEIDQKVPRVRIDGESRLFVFGQVFAAAIDGDEWPAADVTAVIEPEVIWHTGQDN